MFAVHRSLQLLHNIDFVQVARTVVEKVIIRQWKLTKRSNRDAVIGTAPSPMAQSNLTAPNQIAQSNRTPRSPPNNKSIRTSIHNQTETSNRATPSQIILSIRTAPNEQTLSFRSAPNEQTPSFRSAPNQQTLSFRTAPNEQTLSFRSAPNQQTPSFRLSPNEKSIRSAPNQTSQSIRIAPNQTAAQSIQECSLDDDEIDDFEQIQHNHRVYLVLQFLSWEVYKVVIPLMYLASVYIIMNGNNSMWMGGLGKHFIYLYYILSSSTIMLD